jgi:hypothetical protein
MSHLANIPTELISHIGTFLPPNSIYSLRLTNTTLNSKISYNFHLLFPTVKVSLTSTSLHALDTLTQTPQLATKISHLTIGTESLAQYRHAPIGHTAALDTMLATEPSLGDLGAQLRSIIVERLGGLKCITIEDRPSYPDIEKKYSASIGSAEIERSTGVDISWNGPYSWIPGASWPPCAFRFPVAARSAIYAAVLDIVRILDMQGRVPELKIVMRGYEASGWSLHIFPEVIRRSDKGMWEGVGKYLTQLSLHLTGTNYAGYPANMWPNNLRGFVRDRGIKLVEL